MMDFSKIKLIIWDLDDTIWQGTLSEDGENGIVLDSRIVGLFKRLTDCGIINSICSKNTKEEAIPILNKIGLEEYIVFPSIDWTPKGERIHGLITAMSLRPENVLFIDDNTQNLKEAEYYSKGLMTCLPSMISDLCEYFYSEQPKDISHDRLKQYRILEKKYDAASKFNSNEEFLYSSNIIVEIHHDCLNQVNRLYELSQRTNQLNFTKNREGIDDFKFSIETADNAGYVTVRDNFGDYGIVGLYIIKNGALKHFLFSCRTIGQGIEQYVYSILDCPRLTIVGEVYNEVSKDAGTPKWINQKVSKHSVVNREKMEGKVLLQGACDLGSTQGYLLGNIVANLSYTGRKGNLVETHIHHTGIINQLLPDNIKTDLVNNLPFVDEKTFDGDFWEGKYDLIVLSTLSETNHAVYRRLSDGIKIAFGEALYPMTEAQYHEGLISGKYFNAGCKLSIEFLQDFSKKWEHIGKTTTKDYINFLDSV
ncbi:MAG: HAD-IIIC family phosphatase, partial [Bacteroidales bacterium]|nr:HAD-IIIC family phosphatase [Bacteroidales bacterium]